jgi:dipeptidase E
MSLRIFSVTILSLLISSQVFAASPAPVGASNKLHLLLLSNTYNEGKTALEHALPNIDKWRGKIDSIVFIPYASLDEKDSIEKNKAALSKLHITVESLPDDERASKILERAQAIYVGGGNTYKLLDTLQSRHLLEPLRKRILNGMPYMGSSAGTVIIAPTIQTTNDMAIIVPKSFKALHILPFQINVHFSDTLQCSPGEFRADRLLEFVQLNETPILALRQGSWLEVDGGTISLGGAGARIFRHGDNHSTKPREFPAGTNFNFQLN